MESDFAFFLPDTFIIITQRGGGELSLRKSDFAVVAKVQQRERREVMMRSRGESLGKVNNVCESRKGGCRAQGKGRKKVSIYIASPSYHHIPL